MYYVYYNMGSCYYYTFGKSNWQSFEQCHRNIDSDLQQIL